MVLQLSQSKIRGSALKKGTADNTIQGYARNNVAVSPGDSGTLTAAMHR